MALLFTAMAMGAGHNEVSHMKRALLLITTISDYPRQPTTATTAVHEFESVEVAKAVGLRIEKNSAGRESYIHYVCKVIEISGG